MDELTLLRNFHRDTPGPSAAETAAARARLLETIDDPQLRASRLMASRRRLAVLTVLGQRRLWAPVAAAAAVTAVAITAAAIAAPGPQAGRPASPSGSPAPASVLREAAAAAARQPPGHGRYFAAEIEIVGNPANPARACCNPSGVGVAIQWFGDGVIGRLAGLNGRTIAEFPDTLYFGPAHGLTWAQLQRLPTAPRRLQAVIAQAFGYGGMPQVAAEFALIAELLATAPAPPALRSALYRVDAMLPGLVLVPHARDPIGRAAAEVYTRAANGDGGALYFNPSTGAVLDVAARPSLCSGVWGRAVLASGYVSSKYQLPAGAVRTARPAVRLSNACGKPTVPPSPIVTSSPMPVCSLSPTTVPQPTAVPSPTAVPQPTPVPQPTSCITARSRTSSPSGQRSAHRQ